MHGCCSVAIINYLRIVPSKNPAKQKPKISTWATQSNSKISSIIKEKTPLCSRDMKLFSLKNTFARQQFSVIS